MKRIRTIPWRFQRECLFSKDPDELILQAKMSSPDTMRFKPRNVAVAAVLILMFAIEAYCVTYYKYNTGGFLNTSVLFICVGLLTATVPFLMVPTPASDNGSTSSKYAAAAGSLILLASGVALLVYCFTTAARVFPLHPLDYRIADMIPQIKVCDERLLNGEKVYAPIPKIWTGMKPTYLPMMWLPWIPFNVFSNDLRWTSVALLNLALLLLATTVPRRSVIVAVLETGLIVTIGVLTRFMFQGDPFFIAYVEEPVVISYYLLLGFALIRNKPWQKGVAISCCVLSRYVLLFWIPAYLMFVYVFESKKNAWIIFCTVAAATLFVFVLPFFIWQPEYYLDVITYYHDVAKLRLSWDANNYSTQLGLAKLFTLDKMDWLIRLEAAAVVMTPFAALGFFVSQKKRLVQNKEFFGLCSLKLTMVLFYAFVEIPFDYLFFVPAFFTVPICIQAMRRC